MTDTGTYSWRRIDVDDGLGLVSLSATGKGFVGEAVEVVSDRGEAWACRFTVQVTADWITEQARVEVIRGSGSRSRSLIHDLSGVWTVDKQEIETPQGCLDIDIASTPFTNTLPIRRLNLEIGASREIDVVWVDVPNLGIEIVRQRYKRLTPENGSDRYLYASVGSDSTYELTVDSEGVVIDYERFAARLGSSRQP